MKRTKSSVLTFLAVIAITVAAIVIPSLPAVSQVGTGLGKYIAPKVINVPVKSEAAIRAAIVKAVASVGPDVIMLPDCGTTGITLTAPLPLITGISYEGVPPVMTHASSVPDNDFTFVGGTWFKGDNTFPCFQAQSSTYVALDVDKGSPDANFSTTGIRECNLRNVGIGASGLGFTKGISVGAKNQCGLLYSRVENVWVRDCLSASNVYSATKWAAQFQNCQHCHFSGLWSYNNSNGWFFSSSVVNTTLQCGNYVVDSVFHNQGAVMSAADRRRSRGIVFTAQYDGFLNEVYGTRLQTNRFNQTQLSETATCAASTSVTVADSSLYQVGMPVVFTTTRNQIIANDTCFVLSLVDSTHITVGASPNGSALTGAVGTSVLKTWGMPNFEAYGDRVTGAATLSKVTNCVFDGLDLEGDSSAQFFAERMEGCTVKVVQWGNGTATVHKMLVARNSQPNNYVCTGTTLADFDAGSSQSWFDGNLNYTAYSFPQATNYLPFGLLRNTTTGDVSLAVSPYLDALKWCNRSGGGYLQPGLAIGVNSTPWPYAAGSLNSGHGGTVVCYGQAATTIALPTIDNAATGNIGWRCLIMNHNTGILTVNSGNSEIMNGLTGKTSITLPPKTATDASWAYVEIQRINGVNMYLVTSGQDSWGAAAQTQSTDKSTAVTLSALTGLLTLSNATLNADTTVSFTLTNTQIAANDMVEVIHDSVGTLGAYTFAVTPGAGSAVVAVHNCTPGNLGEAIKVRFWVHKARS